MTEGQLKGDELFVAFVRLTEQAKEVLDTIRTLKIEEHYDGRSLSIASTHLETAQLWTANARRD